MKNFKKLMALVIAAVMVVGSMSLGAFAAPGDLTVNGELTVSGLDEGDTVDVYQILKWDPDNSIKVKNGVVDATGTPVGWVWGDNIDTSKSGITDALLLTIIGAADGTGKISSDTAGILAGCLTGTPKFDDAAVTGSGEGNAKWTDTVDKAGLYMAVVTPKTAGTMYNPIFVAANYYGDGETPDESNSWAVVLDEKTYSNEGMAKKSKIPLEKTSKATDTDNNLKDTTNMSHTADMDEQINFEVTSKVPKFGANYVNPVFKFVDNLHGIGLVANSVIVTKANGSALPTDSYTIGSYAEGATQFTITFDPDYLRGLNSFASGDNLIPADGQEILIKYSGIVNGDATKIVNQKDNTIDLVFSTTPDDQTGKGLLRDQTNHFTFSIDADLLGHSTIEGSSTETIKVGVDAEGNYIVETSHYEWSDETHGPLEGATFGFYDSLPNAQAGNSNYYTNSTFGGTVTTDATGRLNITGLDAGTYYLKELTAPAGYIKLQDVIEVKITADIDENISVKDEVDDYGDPVTVTYKTNTLNGYTVEFKNLTTNKTGITTYTIEMSESSALAVEADRVTPSSDFELPNTKGVELPSTGGMGTTLFYAIGAILVLGAGILLVSKRRMSAN